MERIYLDHSATTPLDKEVFAQMTPYFCEDFGNADSPHAHGRGAQRGVDTARDRLAELLHAKPNELYFTSGGTEADNWAIFGGARGMKERGKARVLLSAIEHHAVSSAAEALRAEGFTVDYLPVDGRGIVAPEALQNALTPDTGLVAVMWANNETGTVQDIPALAKIAKANGSLFFTDAVQAAPYFEMDVTALGVDMLSLSAHKFYGPKGAGALYIKNGSPVKPLIVGGEQERGRRGGTTNVPAIVGLSLAYEKNAGGMVASNGKIARLRALFLREITDLSGVTVQGEGVPAIVNLRAEGVKNTDLVYALDLQGVSISAGAACASGSTKPSHVLLAMGLSEKAAGECVRVSFGKDNSEEEILRAATLFKETVLRLRG